MDMEVVGTRIRQQRKIKGLTQEQLAEMAGISGMSIRRYEAGERIATMDVLQRIAAALHITTAAILPPENYNESEADDREYWQRLLAKKVEPLNARGMRKAVDYVLDISRIDEYTELDDAEKPTEGD